MRKGTKKDTMKGGQKVKKEGRTQIKKGRTKSWKA